MVAKIVFILLCSDKCSWYPLVLGLLGATFCPPPRHAVALHQATQCQLFFLEYLYFAMVLSTVLVLLHHMLRALLRESTFLCFYCVHSSNMPTSQLHNSFHQVTKWVWVLSCLDVWQVIVSDLIFENKHPGKQKHLQSGTKAKQIFCCSPHWQKLLNVICILGDKQKQHEALIHA